MLFTLERRKRQLSTSSTSRDGAGPSNEAPPKTEEQWSLKDVIFVEDVKSVPVGRVLKVRDAG